MVKHLFFPSAVIVVLAAVPEVLPGHPPTAPDVQTCVEAARHPVL